MTVRAHGWAILALATGLVCLVVGFGPGLAMRVVPALLGARVESAALVETVFTLLIFAPLIAAGMIGARRDGRSALALGPSGGSRLAVGLAIGIAGVSAATLYARLAGVLVPGPAAATGAAMLLWGLAVVVVQAGAEEVFFRGWLQPSLVRSWGAAPALLATALSFAIGHIAGGVAHAPLSMLNLFLGGLVFGALAWRGGGLALALGMHIAWNAGEQLLYGLDPNPGVGSFGAIADHELVGRALWGGSGEGLNASLGMTIVLLAILLPIALLSRGAGAISPTLSPAPHRSGRVPS